MDFETLFTSTKWEILSLLSKQKQSPLELATKLNTTIANISQQLRLLEAAGLVITSKTREAERGKPRVLYSIAKDFVYVIALQQGAAQKRMIEATTQHKIISRIWQLKNSDIHNEVQKAFWKVESMLSDITGLGFDEISNTLYIESEKERKIEDLRIKVKFVSTLKNDDLSILYKKSEGTI